MSRSNHHHNLLRLCVTCHERYDGGEISGDEIRAHKAKAIDRVQARFHDLAEPRWPVRGAPPLATQFLGRENELDALIDGLRAGDNICVAGVGGIGKTQLILHALKGAALDRRVIWVGLDTMSSAAEVEENLVTQAREIGVEIFDGHPLFDKSRVCLVFDGLERVGNSHDEALDLLPALLAAYSDTPVIVTSQVALAALDFDRSLTLGPLDPASASGLLASPVSDDGSADLLLEFADGHPLTLRLLNVLIRHLGSADAVHAELARRSANAVAEPQRRNHNSQTSLTVCLDLAWSRLSNRERRLLWFVAASPAGFRPGLHEALVGPDIRQVSADVRAWNLADQWDDDDFEPGSPTGQYLSMLSPVRAFVNLSARIDGSFDLTTVSREFCESQMMLSTLVQNVFLRRGSVPLGRALMDRELPNSLSAFTIAAARAGDDKSFLPVVFSIAHSTMMTLFTSGEFVVGARIMKKAAAAAEQSGELGEAMQFLYQMQTLAERQYDRNAAASALAEGERVAKNAEGEVLAMLFLMRASAAEYEGDFDRAAQLARESREHSKEGDDSRRSASFILGRALEFGGNHVEALPFFLESLEAAEREEDPINRGSILHHIGNCEAYAGRYQDALHAYRKAGEQFLELDVVEFISNALGEAGLILPELDPIVGMPKADAIVAGLFDIARQLQLQLESEEFGGRNPRVSLRKFAGLMSLALHRRQEELFLDVADAMYERLVAPFTTDSSEPREEQKLLLFQIQFLIRLMQFFVMLARDDMDRPLKQSELHIMAVLASRAFVSLEQFIAAPLASYLRRAREMTGLTEDDLLILMRVEDAAGQREAERLARLEGVDPGWMS